MRGCVCRCALGEEEWLFCFPPQWQPGLGIFQKQRRKSKAFKYSLSLNTAELLKVSPITIHM